MLQPSDPQHPPKTEHRLRETKKLKKLKPENVKKPPEKEEEENKGHSHH